MDDEPIWAVDRVVALTPGSIITIPKTANEFAIKADSFPLVPFQTELRLEKSCASLTHENESLTDAWLCMKEMLRNCHGHNLSKGNIIKIFYHGLNKITQEVLNAAAGGIFLYKTPNQAYQLLKDKVLLKLDWAKNQKTKTSLKKIVAFANEELQSRAKQPTPDLDDDDIPMSREEEAKFMQTFRKTRFYNDYRDRDSNRDNWRSSGRNDYNRDNYRSNTDDKSYDLQRQFNDFMKYQQSTNAFFDRLADKQSGRPSGSLPSNTQPNPRGSNSKAYQPPQSRNEHVNAVFTRSVKQKQLNLGVGTERMIFNIDYAIKHSYSNDDTCFSIDVIDEILEEDFDALLDEGRKILHSIEGTVLEEEIFSEFDKFIAMTSDEIYDSESDTKEPPPSTRIIKSKHLSKNLLRISNSNLFPITWNMYFSKNPHSFL
ncbi:hypothetical protein Tco_0051350 [Tanacetum coccineum]